MSITTNEPKTMLKDIDGSLITKPELEDKVVWISEDFEIYKSKFWGLNNPIIKLQKGLIFLLEDQKLAEKKSEMLKKQLEITSEIKRLNAEQGYKFSKENRNYYLIFDYRTDQVIIRFDCNYCLQISNLHTSEEIANQIYKKYSQSDLKMFFEIID